MKNIIKIFLLVAVVSLGDRLNASSDNKAVNGKGTNRVVIPSLGQRQAMSTAEHLQWLENNGEVPLGADQAEWEMSKQTSWWGKPLDPGTFWKGKVLWLDDMATRAANGHGRRFPPIPFEDPHFARRHINDWDGGPAGPDSPDSHLFQTDKENAFWDKFVKTHPHPPEDIQRTQSRVADRSLRAGGPTDDDFREPRKFGYPKEAFTKEALFWTYVMDERQEYLKWNQGRPADKTILRLFFQRLAVDPKYIKEPLTAQQTEKASAWKLAYLQRLQQRNTDQSYINAYLKAWNLPASTLSTGPKK
jgi:hypothetical protein